MLCSSSKSFILDPHESYGPEPFERELLSASPASVVLKGARALQYRQRIAQSHRGTLVRRCATRRGIVVIVVVPVWSGPAVSLVRLPVLGGSTVVHQTPSPTARRPAILMCRPALQAVVYRAAVCVMDPPSLSAVACACTPLPRLVWGIRPGVVPQPVVSDCVPRVSDVLRLQPRPRARLLGGLFRPQLAPSSASPPDGVLLRGPRK